MEKLLLKPEEGAEAANISRALFFRLLAEGKIPSVKIGKLRRIPVTALRDWVVQMEAEQNPPRA